MDAVEHLFAEVAVRAFVLWDTYPRDADHNSVLALSISVCVSSPFSFPLLSLGTPLEHSRRDAAPRAMAASAPMPERPRLPSRASSFGNRRDGAPRDHVSDGRRTGTCGAHAALTRARDYGVGSDRRVGRACVCERPTHPPAQLTSQGL